MRKSLIPFALLGVLFSCNPENNPSEEKNNPKELIVTAEASEIEYSSATLSGYANLSEGMNGITFGIILSKDENPTVDNGKLYQAKELDKNNRFYCKISNLSIGTKYYYKAYLKEGDYYRTGSKTLSFTTKDFADDLIVTGEATEIDYISAVLNGSASIPSGLTGSSFGFILSENEDPTLDNGKVIQCQELDGSNKFSYKTTSLSIAKTYYYKAFFKYDGEYRTGKIQSFTTKDFADNLIITTEATEIEWFSAVLNGSVNIPSDLTENYSLGFIFSDWDPNVNDGYVFRCNKLEADNQFHIKVMGLSTATTYYYKAYFKYNGEYRTGKAVRFTTEDVKETGQEAVDLGLSVKWGSCNIGASNPLEYGHYYAWGETEPKDDYSWINYKWGDNPNQFIKYCTLSRHGNNGFVDGKTVLDPEDDVAHVILGGKWRMPTHEEWTELRDKCTWKWISTNGQYCYFVTGPSGKSIFLPAAGGRYGTRLDDAGASGLYWSCSLETNNPFNAMYVTFDSGNVYWGFKYRCYGLSVRPVSE